MRVFQAVRNAESGDHHTICFRSGEVTLSTLEARYSDVLERATTQDALSHLREVKMTVTGTPKENIVPEISRWLRRFAAQGVQVVMTEHKGERDR